MRAVLSDTTYNLYVIYMNHRKLQSYVSTGFIFPRPSRPCNILDAPGAWEGDGAGACVCTV